MACSRASEAAKKAGVSSGVVKGLAKVGGLVAQESPVDPRFDNPNPDHPSRELTRVAFGRRYRFRKNGSLF